MDLLRGVAMNPIDSLDEIHTDLSAVEVLERGSRLIFVIRQHYFSVWDFNANSFRLTF